MELTEPLLARGRGGGPQGGVGDPEADLLALHVAARLRLAGDLVDAGRGEQRVAGLLADRGHAQQDDEDDGHGGQHRPALAGVADHLAERVAQGAGDEQDGEHLDEVRERGGVLERDGPS